MDRVEGILEEIKKINKEIGPQLDEIELLEYEMRSIINKSSGMPY